MKRLLVTVLFGFIILVRSGPPLSLGDISWPNLSSSSLLPSGIWLRWKASDLVSSPVASWSDENQGWTFSQATGANKPTWDTNGVHFDGVAQYMTTSNLLATMSWTGGTPPWQSWLIIGQYIDAGGTYGMLSSGNNCAGGVIFYGSGSGSLIDGLGSGPTPTPSTVFDFLTSSLTTNSYRAYTNGISCWTNAGSWNDGITIQRMGSPDAGAACQFKGLVKEIIVWTNVFFGSVQSSNIHHYATNTYGFSP